jgi:hypothetical protein
MTTDSLLAEKTIAQLTFKPSICRDVAAAIVQAVMATGLLYSDEINLDFVAEPDANTIGPAWKRLADVGIVEPTGRFHRSTKESSRGRKVFEYRVASLRRAQTFLARNGQTVPPTPPQMFA